MNGGSCQHSKLTGTKIQRLEVGQHDRGLTNSVIVSKSSTTVSCRAAPGTSSKTRFATGILNQWGHSPEPSEDDLALMQPRSGTTLGGHATSGCTPPYT